jgi:hypothetical protein
MSDIPDRQAHAIEIQRRIFALPADAPFDQSFIPHGHAVNLLATIAASDSKFADDARAVLAEWRTGLATPAIEAVETDNELEVGGGAVVSLGSDGYWISTWTWVGP